MAQHPTSYQGIDRPYDNLLQRGVSDVNRTSNTGPGSSTSGNAPTAGGGTSGGGSSAGGGVPGGPSSSTSGGGAAYSAGSSSPSSSNGNLEVMPVKSDGAMSDIWIDNFIRSKNWKPKKVGFNIDGLTGKAEFTNVFISGEIEALSGVIGGFTIGDTDLSVTSGDYSTIISSGDIAFQAGPTNDPTLIITKDGALTATQANITGSISAQSGVIGGFEIFSDHLTAGYGPTRIRLDTVQGIFLGNNAFELAPFSVTLAGRLHSTSGSIGGWEIGDTTISSNGITLDSALEKITVGSTVPIYIDGVHKRIYSYNYIPGMNGQGFSLDPNLLEVGNISARGMIRTAVFQKDVVSSVGGNLMVLNSDVLDADMTMLDSSTVKIKGTTSFNLGDVLRIKDGTDDEWLLIDNVTQAPIYGVLRDRALMYPPNENPMWKKGAAVVSYGGNGDGGLYMTSSEATAPYMDIFDHNGSPWLGVNTRMRMGNLNGYLGYTSDVYGIGIGEADKFLKYDPVSGLNMQGNITIGINNSIKGGQTAFNTGSGFFLGYSDPYHKFSIGDPNLNYMTWDGQYLKLKGSFDVGDGGVINNSVYTVNTLPNAPIAVGFNNPSALG